jgi:2-amino-4-hydroxy-6-hydroxymethyldihydropteridine diphosphokinase
MKTIVFIGLGSNMGNREAHLKKAVQLISAQVGPVIEQSSVYETKPWGNTTQPDFLNQVIQVITEISPEDCMNQLLQIENSLGRVRSEKWGPRSIDLDLLYYGNQIINSPNLQVPHPGNAYRKFVLIPLTEIAPDFIHPVLHKTHQQLLNECSDGLDVKLAYRLDTSA